MSMDAAVELLTMIGQTMRPDDRLLLGTDLAKERSVLEAAYDDRPRSDRGLQSEPAAANQPRARGRFLRSRPSSTGRSTTRTAAGSRCTW